MEIEDALTKLEYVKGALRPQSGYAYDIVSGLLDPEADFSERDTLEADALFRTLVLDEHWEVDEAREVYEAAYSILEQS